MFHRSLYSLFLTLVNDWNKSYEGAAWNVFQVCEYALYLHVFHSSRHIMSHVLPLLSHICLNVSNLLPKIKSYGEAILTNFRSFWAISEKPAGVNMVTHPSNLPQMPICAVSNISKRIIVANQFSRPFIAILKCLMVPLLRDHLQLLLVFGAGAYVRSVSVGSKCNINTNERMFVWKFSGPLIFDQRPKI